MTELIRKQYTRNLC